MRIRTLIPAAAACAALLVPAAASAHPGDKQLGHAAPAITRLCNAVANGHVPAKLQGHEADVTQACDDFNAAVTQAQTDAKTALDSARQQVSDARTAARTACQAARQGGDRQACRDAIANMRTVLQTVKGQVGQAVSSYRAAVGAARQTFVTTLRSLVTSG